jgi:hypothetical protein
MIAWHSEIQLLFLSLVDAIKFSAWIAASFSVLRLRIVATTKNVASHVTQVNIYVFNSESGLISGSLMAAYFQYVTYSARGSPQKPAG